MAQDRFQALANMTTRQKTTIVVFILIIGLLIWQLMGLFGGSETTSTVASSPLTAAPPQNAMTPQPAPLPKPVTTQQDIVLLQQQQQLEAKYLAALNELQMLRLEREIAEVNKAIMDARLGTVTAQKSIVDLLSPAPAPQVSQAGYAQRLAGGTIDSTTAPVSSEQAQNVTYTVVSISQLKSRWNAVLGFQTNLYNVSIGDILPPDGSTVVSINRGGVILEKGGVKRKLSLVPII